jgi:hypothetical protein
MPNKQPEEYLQQAQEAERAADLAPTEAAKDCWRAIAREYRELAAEQSKHMQSNPVDKKS